MTRTFSSAAAVSASSSVIAARETRSLEGTVSEQEAYVNPAEVDYLLVRPRPALISVPAESAIKDLLPVDGEPPSRWDSVPPGGTARHYVRSTCRPLQLPVILTFRCIVPTRMAIGLCDCHKEHACSSLPQTMEPNLRSGAETGIDRCRVHRSRMHACCHACMLAFSFHCAYNRWIRRFCAVLICSKRTLQFRYLRHWLYSCDQTSG